MMKKKKKNNNNNQKRNNNNNNNNSRKFQIFENSFKEYQSVYSFDLGCAYQHCDSIMVTLVVERKYLIYIR